MQFSVFLGRLRVYPFFYLFPGFYPIPQVKTVRGFYPPALFAGVICRFVVGSDKWRRSWKNSVSRNAWLRRTNLQCATSRRWSRRCRSTRRSWTATRRTSTWPRTAWNDTRVASTNSARSNR